MNDSNKLHPQKFEITYHCFTSTIFNEVNFKEGKLILNHFFSGEEIVPDNAQWEKFWKKMEKLEVWNWKREYENIDVLDGCSWSLHIEYNGQKIKSEGSNHWPENFKEFIRALKDLTDFDVTKEVKLELTTSDSDSENHVQSAITTISFPRDLEGLEYLVEKNEDFPIDFYTDMDVLLSSDVVFNYIKEYDGQDHYNWTAPRWMSEGDILFYYHSLSSINSSKNVFKESKEAHAPERIIENAEHGMEIADKYAGKIFGCSKISGSTQYFDYYPQHFRGRNFAPINEVHIFENPVDIKEFSEFLKITRGGTITPISRDDDFQRLKELLSENNELPDYLKTAQIGNNNFRNVGKDNWREVSCSINSSFLYEDQIRSYLIDYFLKEIKDNSTRLYEECDCFRDSKMTGTADYFMKLNSTWVPVEAKVNILSEKDIHQQLSKYLHIDSFRPTLRNKEQKEFEVFNPKFALIIDQSGVYIYNEGEFVDCEPGQPLWPRVVMSETDKIRKKLISYLEEFS